MAAKTKEKILVSAKKLIGDKGYNNTKVIDITRDAGIAKGSFYTYFQTKEDVFVELLEKMFKEFHEKFDDIEYQGELRVDVAEFVGNIYETAILDKTGIKILIGMFMSAELSERIIKIRNKFMRGTEQQLKTLFKNNSDILDDDTLTKLDFVAPAMEKMIRVYVVSTMTSNLNCGPFSDRKELGKEEIDEHKEFLSKLVYKALSK